jgi:hypothetical protein
MSLGKKRTSEGEGLHVQHLQCPVEWCRWPLRFTFGEAGPSSRGFISRDYEAVLTHGDRTMSPTANEFRLSKDFSVTAMRSVEDWWELLRHTLERMLRDLEQEHLGELGNQVVAERMRPFTPAAMPYVPAPAPASVLTPPAGGFWSAPAPAAGAHTHTITPPAGGIFGASVKTSSPEVSAATAVTRALTWGVDPITVTSIALFDAKGDELIKQALTSPAAVVPGDTIKVTCNFSVST